MVQFGVGFRQGSIAAFFIRRNWKNVANNV